MHRVSPGAYYFFTNPYDRELALPVQQLLHRRLYVILANALANQSSLYLSFYLDLLTYLVRYPSNQTAYYLALLSTITPLSEDELCRPARSKPSREVFRNTDD